MWGWDASLGDSRGTSVGAQPAGEQRWEAELGVPAFLVSFSLCQNSCVCGQNPFPILFLCTASFPLLYPPSLRSSSPLSSFCTPYLPLSLNFSSFFSSPSFFMLHPPAVHHSVLVIHLPSHLCFLLRGGCDHRNILEGEEGAEWEAEEQRSRAEHDSLCCCSERGCLVQLGQGTGACVSG